MTAALLDHPWPLDQALDPQSDGFRVLDRFDELVRAEQLEIVRFISRDEYNKMWERIARTTGWAAVGRFAAHFVRDDSPEPLAIPVDEPAGLTLGWKSALREAMGDLQDWRNPQVIVASKRRQAWPPGDEVRIRVDDGSGPSYEDRALAQLETYRTHQFAVSDRNPWDLQRVHPPVPGGQRQHPCMLPRPPILQRVRIEDLNDRLHVARARGWQIEGKHYFIPPGTWRTDQTRKQAWRTGRAFPYELLPVCKHPGPVDYAGRVWEWDRNERHWDVQAPAERFRISHTGDPL
jgi:hypothetical protein